MAVVLALAAGYPLCAQDMMDGSMNGTMGGTSGGAAAGTTDDDNRRSVIGIWGGYTTAGMGDVNDNLSTRAGSRGSVTKITDGYAIAGEYLYAVSPQLVLGPRVEYIGLNQGKATTALSEVKQDYYLIPLMVGGRYYFMDRKNPWNLSGGAFLGVGLGYGKSKATVGSVSRETSFDGTGFTGNVLLGGEVRLSDMVSLGLDLGYRYADIPSMSTGSSTAGGGGGGYAPKARKTTVVNSSGSTIKYDFSGMIANIGLNMKF
jgi:hypothetical protein